MEDISEILKITAEKLKNSYSKYSNFSVAAAVLGENGKWYYGVNVENKSYGLTICAERSAAVSAVTDGVKLFKKVIVISESEELITPCGACREFLAEFCSEDSEILLGTPSEIKFRGRVLELLPMRFIF